MEKTDINEIASQIEKIKKEFKSSSNNPYRVLIYNKDHELEHRAYPVLSLALEVCKDAWTNKGAYAVEAFHLDAEGNVVVDYHAIRNF